MKENQLVNEARKLGLGNPRVVLQNINGVEGRTLIWNTFRGGQRSLSVTKNEDKGRDEIHKRLKSDRRP